MQIPLSQCSDWSVRALSYNFHGYARISRCKGGRRNSGRTRWKGCWGSGLRQEELLEAFRRDVLLGWFVSRCCHDKLDLDSRSHQELVGSIPKREEQNRSDCSRLPSHRSSRNGTRGRSLPG